MHSVKSRGSNVIRREILRNSMAAALVASAALVVALSGCKESTSDPFNLDRIVVLIEVFPSSASIAPGAAMSVSAVAKNVNDEIISNQTFTWQTSDNAVATVNANGVITGVALGSATITASAGGVTSNDVAVAVAPIVVPTGSESSSDLIDAAFESGTLNCETALVYKVFASYGDSRLPAQYRGNDSEVMESDVHTDLLENYDLLSDAAKLLVGPYTLRPSNRGSWLNPLPAGMNAPGSAPVTAGAITRPACFGDAPLWTSIAPATAKVRVWYDTRRAADKTQAEFVANYMETVVWPRLITALGFKEPLPDPFWGLCDGGDGRLDMYIVAGLAARGFAIPQEFSYFRGPVYIELKAGENDVEKRQTVAHEFFHAIQWAYDMEDRQMSYGWFREATANWAVEVADPGNAKLLGHSSCYMKNPEKELILVAKVDCAAQVGRFDRPYGAYLLFQFIGRTKGNTTVKSILAATENENTGAEAVNAAVGGIENVWKDFVKTLWNQDPVLTRPAFKTWDGNTYVPTMVLDQSANLGTLPEAETEINEKVNNLSSQYYRFTFSDVSTRSLMFHNTFYDNFKQGQKVHVQAMFKPETAGQPWFEEDWTEYEWIGVCRDLKLQRIAEMVIIVSSAEFEGGNPVVVASQKPKLMRNNLGCYGYEGRGTRTFRHNSWGSGLTTVHFDAKFNTLLSSSPLQYTSRPDGVLRVPIAAPQLSEGLLTYNEQFTDGGCSYATNGSFQETSVTMGGKAVATLNINYFNESLPPTLRAAQEMLVGSAKRAYVGTGVSTRIIDGTVTGPQPACGTQYSSGAGGWFLTHIGNSPRPTVASNGNLIGSLNTSQSNYTEEYTWIFMPVREPP